MIGIIVTGHGGFATGMEKNVRMLAGADTDLAAVDFMEGMAPGELSEKLKAEIERKASCSAILILADIMGGTPYNCAAALSVAKPGVRVIGGINAALLMEACMCNVIGEETGDVDRLVEELIEHARESMTMFVLQKPAGDQGACEDGI